jgi:hypothetical protein
MNRLSFLVELCATILALAAAGALAVQDDVSQSSILLFETGLVQENFPFSIVNTAN